MKDLKKESNKATKTYFDMGAGCYCGLLLEKRLAIRMSKLLFKQQQEIKELLSANIDETEVSDWTLAYPDNEQKSVKYYDKNKTATEKLDRVSLFTKEAMIKRCDEVFIAENGKEAELRYLEYYDKLEYKRCD